MAFSIQGENQDIKIQCHDKNDKKQAINTNKHQTKPKRTIQHKNTRTKALAR